MPIKLAEIKKENDEKEKKEVEQKYDVIGGLKLAKQSSSSKSENKPWYKNVVKGSNLFDDGYDFGDITRTTLNTATNVGANLLKGVSNIGDAVAKTIVGGIATGADILGYDNYADKLKNRLAGKDEVVNERLKNYTPSGLLQKANDATKSNSVVGDTTRDVAQGVGYYAGMLAGQSVGIPWQVTSGVTSVGNELPEAYAQGASNAQAWLSAGISAGFEIGSEYVFGGIKLPGTGKTTETILNKATSKIENKALKYITQAGVNILGEGAEEVISGIGSAIGKQLTYMNDKELNEIYTNEDKLQDFVMGALVSAVTIGANPTTYQNVKTGRSLINGLTVDEEENLANSKLNNNQNPSLNNPLNQNKENYQKTSISSINNLVQTNNENLFNYNDTNNQKINNLYQSAKESRLNNSQETQQLIDTISKVIEDKNYNILLDNTITNENGDSVNAKITTNPNNEIEIRINPDSDRAGEFLLVHEISHAIKTPEMIQLVNDFASRNEGFAKAVKEIETTYGKNLTSEEVFADVCGQLFGNQEFINTLETQNTEQSKSLIRQIYEAIKKLLNRLTAEGRYRNFVQDLEVRWRNAYRQSVNNLNENVNYAKGKLMSGEDVVVSDDVNGSHPSKKEAEQNLKSMLGIKYVNSKSGTEISIENKDIKKYLNDGYNNQKNTRLKKRISGNYGEILEIAKMDTSKSKQNYKGTNRGKQGFDYYNVTLAYPIRNVSGEIIDYKYYEARLVVRKDNNNNFAYDLDNFKEKKGAVLDKTSLSIMADKSAHGSFNDTNIPQTDVKVNSDTSTKYSMPLNENNTQELVNSSFNFADAKQYDDLIKTNYIEYFRKDNGDVKVYLMDSNNNLVNDFTVWSNKNAIENLGENLGNKIYETASDTHQKIGIGNDINNLGIETDYFMNHRPSEGYGNASNFETNMAGIFEHPEWYLNLDEKYNNESLNALKKVRNNPETEITIYRATPGNKINVGDWVTPSKSYAQYHNNTQFNGKGNILEIKVKAKDILFAGDDINEFGYFPGDSAKYSQYNSKWQAHLEKTYKSNGTRTYFDNLKLKGNEMLKSNAKYSEIIKNESDNKKVKKNLNPNEIADLSVNDALTTPELSKVNVEKGNGESHYWSNIKDKTNMLNDTQKEHILSNDEVKYYKKITNEESLNEAFEKLNKGGASETLRWAKMDSKDATAADVAEGWILLKQYSDSGDYNSMVEVAKKMRDIGTKAGQTVQAFNIMARMSPEGMVKYAQSELSDAYEKMVKGKTKEWIDKYKNDFDLKPNEVKFIMDTMQEVKDMPEGYDKKVKLAEIQKLMTDKLPPDKDGRIKSWMRISMLFNPKTQVRNVAGNAIIAPINYIGDVFASRMDKKIAKKTGVRTTGNMNIKAILEGMKKGAYQATNDYKKGINTKDMDGNRFEISSRKSFSDKNLIGKSLNRTESLLNYVMDAGDRVFSEASFENSLQNQMILNNTTEVTQEMIDIAHEEALSRTWNDNNKYTKFVLSVRSGLNNIKLGGYGLGDVLIPFAKTPANLTKAIVDYSPVGLVNSLTKYKAMNNAIETGQFTAKMQHDFVQTLGKATAGTMLYVLGMALAKAGITSGESDDDKDTRDFIKNTLGINSYSIKIGNKSFTYDWAQPIAAPLSIMANIENSKRNKEQALLEGIVNSLDTAGSILLEQSFLSSINDVLSDNAGVVSGIINEVLELPSRAIPTFSKQIVDLTDTTQRQTYEYDKPLQTATNKIKAKLPGLSKTLSPSVDTMGREILRYGGKNNIFNVFLNPANVNTENISESASEIYRVYKVTGDQTIMPRVTPYYINQKGEKTILSTKERTEYAKVSGKIIEDNIKLLLKNSNYVKLEDEEKSQIIKNIVDYSYNKAREDVVGIEMSNTYNGVKTYTMAKGQISDYYLAKKAVSDVKDKYKGDTTAMKNARKQAIFNYINKLNISKAEKTILFGVTTNYSIKSYRAYLFNYINKLDITKKEKEKIWNKLYD